MNAQSDGPAGTQRLDKWLWFARVVKTRTLATKLVADGSIRLNREKIAKPSAQVRLGDVLTIALNERIRVLKVVATGGRRGPASEAALLFADLTPVETAVRQVRPAERDAGAGRPTKRDRRDLDRLRSRQAGDDD